MAMEYYENLMKDIRSSPLYILASVSHAFSIFISLHAIVVSVRCKKITNWKIRGVTIFTLCWNILSQISIYVIYGFFLSDRAPGAMWLLMNGVMACLVYTDLMILECFQSLVEWINLKVINRMKVGLLVLYVVLNAFIFLRLFIRELDPYNYVEMLCGISFVGLCVVYDNVQVFYLTYVVYTRRGKKDKQQASTALKHAILVNVIVCVVDWISMIIFILQTRIPEHSTQVILQQVSTSGMGIHESLLIFVFRQLKVLTFAGRKISMQPAKQSETKSPRTVLHTNTQTKLV